MATCTSIIRLVSANYFIIVVALLIFQFIPFAASFSFTINDFYANLGDISFDKNATLTNEAIQLTAELASMGRATYSQPMNLWENTSKNLTDFTTHFSFAMDSKNQTRYGDGIAFFLAPSGSVIPRTATKGGSLGLTTDEQPLNSTDNPFLAVEFDIYSNPAWDPIDEHVGIDLNSMRSVTNVSWLGAKTSILGGLKNDAWITYKSSSKNLSVTFTGLSDNKIITQNLYYIVDLRDYLPQNVTFGFTASTGNRSAIFKIYSWGFNTSLELHENFIIPNEPPPSLSKNNRSPSRNNKGLIIGSAIGGATVVAGGFLLALTCYRKRRNGERNEGKF